MPQSKELTNFYKSYLEWVENGAINNKPYSNCTGLCYNLYLYVSNNYIESDLEKEMIDQFKKAGLDRIYPFGKGNYIKDFNLDTMHLDPERIKWVKDHIPE